MTTKHLQEMTGAGLIAEEFIQDGIVLENLLFVRLDVEMGRLQA